MIYITVALAFWLLAMAYFFRPDGVLAFAVLTAPLIALCLIVLAALLPGIVQGGM